MRTIRTLLFASGVLLAAASGADAQSVPHKFSQDTPPIPGQIVKPPREKLRLGPSPHRTAHPELIGLPTSGPKGLQRESFNARRCPPPNAP